MQNFKHKEILKAVMEGGKYHDLECNKKYKDFSNNRCNRTTNIFEGRRIIVISYSISSYTTLKKRRQNKN